MVQVHHFELRSKDVSQPYEANMELHAISFCPSLWKLANAFWQYAGMGISGRYAQMIMDELAQNCELIEVCEPTHSLLVSHTIRSCSFISPNFYRTTNLRHLRKNILLDEESQVLYVERVESAQIMNLVLRKTQCLESLPKG